MSTEDKELDKTFDAMELDFEIGELTKDERSLLVYCESCLVDYGGLLEGQRMNEADLKALRKFEVSRILKYGRIPSALLGEYVGSRKPTHWVQFNKDGWIVAQELRKRRAAPEARGPYARDVFTRLELDGKL